jgi:hypothetical protein
MLADYFARSAVAASQVIEGFDEERFQAHLEQNPVGVAADSLTSEGEQLADMAVRLLARLYPQLAIQAPDPAGARLRELASSINPSIELVDSAELGIVVGDGPPFAESIYAGSDGWDALIATRAPLPLGESENPLGAGGAACLAAAGLFRRVFLPDAADGVEEDLRFSVFDGERLDRPAQGEELPAALGDAVLVGAGAIGHGAIWALRRLPAAGTVHLVDPQRIELSNLQRYVLAERADEDAVKVELAARESRQLELEPYEGDLASFVAAKGYAWPAMLLALDSAHDRVSAQASLPEWLANAWTQPGDLGLSAHSRFGADGACVGCLYLPEGQMKNEDELVAEALGIPQLLMQVRTLLYTGRPVERQVLEAIAQAIGRPLEALLPYEGRTIRELYVEGFCGGAVIPLGQAGQPHAAAPDVHVPLAHQSALAGVLLAGALVRHAISGAPEITRLTKLDLLRAIGARVSQPARAAHDGRSICEDPDFRNAYSVKYGAAGRGVD